MDKFEQIKKWHQEHFVEQCRVGKTRQNVEWMMREIITLRDQVERYKNEVDELGELLDRL